MPLEWDDPKRNKTLAGRGLDFADVASVDWTVALTTRDARGDYAAPRFVTLAQINERLCVFAWCWRGDAMRNISLRKANDRERKSKPFITPDGEVRELGRSFFAQAKRGRPPLPEAAKKRRVNLMLDRDVVARLHEVGNSSAYVNGLLREKGGM